MSIAVIVLPSQRNCVESGVCAPMGWRAALAIKAKETKIRSVPLRLMHGRVTIVGIPENTVKTRMFRARKQLAKLLAAAGIDRVAA